MASAVLSGLRGEAGDRVESDVVLPAGMSPQGPCSGLHFEVSQEAALWVSMRLALVLGREPGRRPESCREPRGAGYASCFQSTAFGGDIISASQ